jgi:hypothetical protein
MFAVARFKLYLARLVLWFAACRHAGFTQPISTVLAQVPRLFSCGLPDTHRYPSFYPAAGSLTTEDTEEEA